MNMSFDLCATGIPIYYCVIVLLCYILLVGPRQHLHFNPTEVRGAIVTCGGLCPGLNSVIHHLVNTLLRTYKAEKVGLPQYNRSVCHRQ